MNRFSRDFETKFGMAVDDKLEQKVKITLLATGFGIQDIHMKEMDDRITQRTAEEQKRLAELEEEEEQRRSRRETYYGKDANTKYQRLRRRHIYIFNPEDLDNADIISMVENSPYLPARQEYPGGNQGQGGRSRHTRHRRSAGSRKRRQRHNHFLNRLPFRTSAGNSTL